MKLAYIIAPYRAPSVYSIHCHIQDAEGAAAALWCAGFAVICPHKNSAYFDGLVPDEQFLSGGLRMLDCCDFAVTVGEWEKSKGSVAEVNHCLNELIPVYHTIREAIKHENRC